jgi:hypothetical protein
MPFDRCVPGLIAQKQNLNRFGIGRVAQPTKADAGKKRKEYSHGANLESFVVYC